MCHKHTDFVSNSQHLCILSITISMSDLFAGYEQEFIKYLSSTERKLDSISIQTNRNDIHILSQTIASIQ